MLLACPAECHRAAARGSQLDGQRAAGATDRGNVKPSTWFVVAPPFGNAASHPSPTRVLRRVAPTMAEVGATRGCDPQSGGNADRVPDQCGDANQLVEQRFPSTFGKILCRETSA
jgi:hypothetical protein